MGFGDLGRVAAGWSTGGLSEVYRAMRPGGGQSGYAALPFENPDNPVDRERLGQTIASVLGRAPTPNELDSYSRYIKSGDLSYDEVGQILAGMPEAQRARLDKDVGAYNDRLAAFDTDILGKAGAQINSQFAGQGRPSSSGMGSALAQVGQNLAMQRQSALADFYGNGLKTTAGLEQGYGQGALSRGQGLQDNRTAFNRSLLGYQTQRNDFNTDLNNENARRKAQAWNTLPFTLAGAGIGGLMGGARGAQAGAYSGTQLGGLFY